MSQSLANPTTTRIFRHARPVLFIIALLLLAGIGLRVSPSAAEDARAIPATALDELAGHDATSEVTVLAGGCFWGVQGVFQHVDVVTNALSGYAGGDKGTAQYETVSTGTTGTCGIGPGHLRPQEDQLWPPPADLFLGRP